MKLLTSLLLSVILLTARAQDDEISYSKNKNSFRLNIRNNSGEASLAVNGTVKISEDNKSISSLTKGGSIMYKKNNRSLRITTNDEGKLYYLINNIEKNAPEADDDQLITDCIHLMRDYGVDTTERSLAKKSGTYNKKSLPFKK